MKNKSRSSIKFFTPKETRELFEVIEHDSSLHALRNIAIFHIAKYCALRASEVSLIEISDYNPVGKTLFLRRLKGSRNNTLQIVDSQVLDYFEAYYWTRKTLLYQTNKIFVSQKGQAINRKTLDKLIKRYCASTNIPGDKQHFHVLRHTRAMELIDYPTVHLRDVQWWLGHKNIQNTMIYLEYTDKAMRLLFDKIKLLESR